MQLSHRRYRRFRRRVLAEQPLCCQCEAEGRTVPATELDHIVPRYKGGEIMARDNVQPLCSEHHEAKTALDLGTIRKHSMPCVHGVPRAVPCNQCQP